MPSRRIAASLLLGIAPIALALFLLAPGASAKWKYFRAGNAADSTAAPRPGFALMGGGEQDPALKFLCERANGGDFLILRANTEDDYAQKVNEEIRALCPLNSAATIVFSEREDSDDPKLLERIGQAEAIFIAGGDQSNYVRFGRTLLSRMHSTGTSLQVNQSAAPVPGWRSSANSHSLP